MSLYSRKKGGDPQQKKQEIPVLRRKRGCPLFAMYKGRRVNPQKEEGKRKSGLLFGGGEWKTKKKPQANAGGGKGLSEAAINCQHENHQILSRRRIRWKGSCYQADIRKS